MAKEEDNHPTAVRFDSHKTFSRAAPLRDADMTELTDSKSRFSDDDAEREAGKLDDAIRETQRSSEVHPFFLTFRDPEMERAFLHYTMDFSSFGAAKVYAFIAFGIQVFLLIVMNRTDGNPYSSKVGPHKSQFHDALWMLFLAAGFAALIFFILMFVQPLKAFREACLLGVLATHWTGFIGADIHRKAPPEYAYCYAVACFYFCCLIGQPRFVSSFILMLVVPIAVWFIMTFGFDSGSYWASHTKLEMFFWIQPVFALLMLRTFERRAREAFFEIWLNRAAMVLMEQRTTMTKRLIANFFPQTATLSFLLSRGTEQYFIYPKTCLVVTDVMNFTAWSASTAPELVISAVSKMFNAADRVAHRYGVEKVSTVGDSYFGAVFPMSSRDAGVSKDEAGSPNIEGREEAEEQRKRDQLVVGLAARNLIKFATVVASSKDCLPARVGVHVGGTIGGFVGIEPPKFDLFGPAVDHCKHMEERGRGRAVHASREVVAAAAGFGVPILTDFDDATSGVTTDGFLFTEWVDSSERPIELPGAVLEASGGSESRCLSLPAEPLLVPPAASELATEPMGGDTAMDKSANESARSTVSAKWAVQQSMEKTGERDTGAAFVVLSGMDVQESTKYFLEEQKMNRELIEEKAFELCDILTHFGEKQKDSVGDLEGRVNVVASPRALGAEFGTDDPEEHLVVADDAAPGRDQLADVEPIEHVGDELALYPFSMAHLTFDDPTLERRYRRWFGSTGISRDVYITLATQTVFLHLAHVLLGCMHSERNRAVAVALGVILVGHFLYVHHADKCVRSRYNAPVVFLTYGAMWTIAAFGHESGCSDHPNQRLYDSEVVMIFSMIFGICTCFVLDVNLWTRVALLVGVAIHIVLCIVLRRALIKDEVLVWDFWVFCIVLAFSMVSYFIDLALRNGFQAQMQCRSLFHNRTKQAAVANNALNMMVPAFVVDRLMTTAATEKKESAEATSELRSNSSAQYLMGVREDDRQFNAVAAHNIMMLDVERVWKYRHAVVMFAYFHPPTLTYSAISDTITRIEGVASRRAIQKVKTIGTTVLFVSGLDHRTPLQHSVTNVLECALDIKARVFPGTAQTEGWNFRVGVHVGECFGAIVGQQGVAFDVFGDTVNTASRMQTNAPPFAIQVSAATKRSVTDLGVKLSFGFRENPERVFMKGKGAMETFVVERDSRARAEEDLHQILGRLTD